MEPYVVAADVYASSTHVGRGGWTWYTGSAAWKGFRIHYRYRETVYHIEVERSVSGGSPLLRLDGIDLIEGFVPLVDDRQEHKVEVKGFG